MPPEMQIDSRIPGGLSEPLAGGYLLAAMSISRTRIQRSVTPNESVGDFANFGDSAVTLLGIGQFQIIQNSPGVAEVDS